MADSEVSDLTAGTADTGDLLYAVVSGNSRQMKVGALPSVLAATQAQAEAGAINTSIMTPLRTAQAAASYVVGTRAVAVLATIPSVVLAIRTTGYTSEGDGGGALYKRVGSVPSHSGYFQSADGAFWEIAERVLSPLMFGASTSASASTNSTALTAALSVQDGNFQRPIVWPAGTFNLQATSHTMPNSAGWSTVSTSSVAVGTGTKAFTVASGLSITAGQNATAYNFKAGEYMQGTVTSYSGTTLTLNITTSSGSSTLSSWNIVQNYQNTAAPATVTIRGAGKDLTRLNFATGSGLTFACSSQQHTVDLQDFSMTTGAEADGTALTLTNTYPFFGEFTGRSRINLHFHGSDGINLTNYWTRCIDVSDVSNIDFSGSVFDGASTPNGSGVRTQAVVGDYACVFDFSGCVFRFLNQGYAYADGTQTAMFIGAFFAQCVTDIFGSGEDHQGLAVIGCEMYKGAAGDGVYLSTSVPNFVYANNRTAVHSGQRAVAMDSSNNFTITGNQFFPDVTANTATSAIDINGTDTGAIAVIDGNTFSSTTVGVRLLGGSAGVKVGLNNRYTGMSSNVTDTGTGNEVHWLRSSTRSGRHAGIGYTTGAGNVATQGTSKSTTVVLDAACGRITMNGAALSSDTTVSFTLTNDAISVNDLLILNHIAGGTAGAYTLNAQTANGSATINVRNITGGSLSEAIVIAFAVIRGDTT